jgi:homoserine dehydrogenase
MHNVNIGLVGLSTVGAGAARTLMERAERIRGRVCATWLSGRFALARDVAQRELRPPGAERQNEGNVTNEANRIRWLEMHKLRLEL